MSRNPSCTLCILHKTSKAVCVDGDGPADAAILLVGEALGAEEEKKEKPFQGPAGEWLNRLLEQAGLSREQVRVTNAIRCRPPGNRDPRPEEIRACAGYLMEEINDVHPKVVVALGRYALAALSTKTAIGENRGKLLESKPGVRLNGATLLGTYHPAAYLHQHSEAVLNAIRDDFRLAVRLAGLSKQEDKTQGGQAYLYGERLTTANIARALTSLEPSNVIVCDLEWTGESDGVMHWPWRKGSQVHSMSLTGRVDSALRTVAIAFPLPDGAHGVLQAFFDKHPLVGHNIQSDLLWLGHHGFRVQLGGDTMLLAFVLDEGQALSLEALATSKAGVQPGWKKPVWPHPPQSDDGWEDLLGHNAGDTEATYLLAEALHQRELPRLPQSEQDDTKRLYRELILPAIPTFTAVAAAGVPVKPASIAAVIEDSKVLINKFSAELGKLADFTPAEAEASAMSPQQTMRLLRERFHIDVQSTGKDVLEEYQEHRPVQLIQAIRHERKFLGTYLQPWYKLALQDGRLHSIYRLTLRTGRTAAELEEGGSLQVAPREDRIRRLIEARPGWKIISADESQLELRLVAWDANERNMLRLYGEGADLHKATAAFMVAYRDFGMPLKDFWPRRGEFMDAVTGDQRQSGKGENFGLVYGMGAPLFRDYARSNYGVIMTAEEAELAHASFFALYPDLHPWHDKCIRDWRERGYIRTPFGRYRRHATDATQAINTRIQATGSDIVMMAMNEIYYEFKRCKMRSLLCGFIHDSVLTETPDEEVEEATAIVVQALEHPPIHRLGVDSLPVALKADVKVGQSWAG